MFFFNFLSVFVIYTILEKPPLGRWFTPILFHLVALCRYILVELRTPNVKSTAQTLRQALGDFILRRCLFFF